MARMGKPIVAVINRMDQVDGDADELVEYLDGQIGIYVQAIFPLSAYRAYEGIRNGDEAEVCQSGFTALYQYLDEHIERHAAEVQLDSIKKSAQVLDSKMQLIHRQALQQIKMKLTTYMKLDEQIQYMGQLMRQESVDRAQNWLQHEFLSSVEMTMQNKINSSNMFHSLSSSSISQELSQELSQKRIHQEICDFLQNLQQDILQDWKTRLSGVDDKIISLYRNKQWENHLELSRLQQNFTEQPGLEESVKESVLAAGAAGGALSLYSAVLGPAASYITIGSAIGSIMPPVLMAGAAVGILTGYSKEKKKKNRQINDVHEILQNVRNTVEQPLLSSIQEYMQNLCDQTAHEAKKEFVEKNFSGRSMEELKELIKQLQIFVAEDTATVYPSLTAQ